MLAGDHQKALEKLTDLMEDYQINPSSALAPDAEQAFSNMSKMTSGAEFDREFVNMMVENHEKALAMFREQDSIARNPDVKKYAEDMLPKLEHHLEEAHKLQSRLFSGKSN